MRTTRTVLTATLMGAGLLLAGCADESGTDPDTDETADMTEESEGMGDSEDMTDDEGMAEDETDDMSDDDMDEGDMMGAATLATADTDLGTILVDGEGMTLYLFTNDEPGVSNCEGECIENWPAVEGEPEAGDGVDEALLGSIERSDGTVQATYNDWPLYYWVQDSAPGDTTGQGVNDVWFVISPEGEMIEAMDDMG